MERLFFLIFELLYQIKSLHTIFEVVKIQVMHYEPDHVWLLQSCLNKKSVYYNAEPITDQYLKVFYMDHLQLLNELC